MSFCLRSPLRHAALAHLEKRARRNFLARYNRGWIATAGMLLFVVVGASVLLASAMLMVTLGLTRRAGHDTGPLLGAAAAAAAIAAGALAWEAFRRVMINRSLDAAPAQTCRNCGYDLAGAAADSPCPECGQQSNTKRRAP